MRVLSPSQNGIRNIGYRPIDKKPKDLKICITLAEGNQKYFESSRLQHPSKSNNEEKWNSISKMLKLSPKCCKRRWAKLKKHFFRGLLTNRLLIDKLQFLKDIANEIPIHKLPTYSGSPSDASSAPSENSNVLTIPLINSIHVENHLFRANEIPIIQLSVNSRSSSNASSTTRENSNLITVPLVDSINDDENQTFRTNDVPVSQLSSNSLSSSDISSATRENSSLILVPVIPSVNDGENHPFRTNENLVSQLPSDSVSSSEYPNLTSVPLDNSIYNDENQVFKTNEVEVADISERTLDIETEVFGGYDSDLEIIEPHIETIVVD